MGSRSLIHPDEIVHVRGPRGVDIDELCAALAPLGLTAYLTNRFDAAEYEIKKLLVEKGVSHVWQLTDVRESLLPATPKIQPLVDALSQMLRRLAPLRDFVVVDRFLLPAKQPSCYLDTLVAILDPVLGRIERLVLVTGKKYSRDLLTALECRIHAANAGCQVIHRTSELFHDRFWIADADRGVLVGTSPNGIGLRYTLVDYMQPADVREIAAALKAEGLI
jgi:hypothetical protein